MVRKSVTTNDLAVMINAGFSDVEKHFGGVEKRLDGLETGIREVQTHLSNIGRDVTEIHKHLVYRDEFDDLMDRVKYLELKLGIKSGK